MISVIMSVYNEGNQWLNNKLHMMKKLEIYQ